MRAFKLGLAIAGVAALAGCSADATSVYHADNGALAYVRFVNAVSDSGAQDWRFVDVIDNSPVAFGLAFRAMFPQTSYQAAGAGSRHLKVFQTSTDIIQTQKVFFDTTFNFTQGTHYTIITAGTMRDKSAKMYILTDDYTDPGAQVALRVFNAGAGSVDLYASASGGTSTLPSALVSGLANFSATKYTNMATGAVSLRSFLAGSTTFPAQVDVVVPAGLPADRSLDLTAVGGTTQAGSVLTAFVFPRSVAGSAAANFTTPSISFIVDRYPPSGF